MKVSRATNGDLEDVGIPLLGEQHWGSALSASGQNRSLTVAAR